MKGDSWIVAVIILAILAFVFYIFYSAGGAGLGLFGGGSGYVFSNDVLTVYDHIISDRAPYDGEKTTIEFSVKNAGKGTMKGIEVLIDPPTGFASQIKCGSFGSCKFDLEQGDAVDVLITLTAVQGVTQIIPVDVRYSIKYPYKGEREVQVPIVANRKEVPRGQTFLMSDNSYGPVQVSFSTPDARETGQGSSVFAVSGIPMKLEMSVSDVGGSQGGTVRPILMKGDDFKLVLSNFKTIFCDRLDAASNTLKVGSGTTSPTTSTSKTATPTSGTQGATSQTTITGALAVRPEQSTGTVAATQGTASTTGASGTTSSGTTSTKVGETVPFEIECVFDPVAVNEGDVQVGVVRAEYKYEYRLDFVDQFAILPKSVPKIEGNTLGVTAGSGVKEDTASDSVDSAASVGKISGTVSLPGTLGSQSDKKYHKFDLEAGAKYAIVLKGCVTNGFRPHMETQIKLADRYQTDKTGLVGIGEKCETIDYTAPSDASPNYYIVVSSKSGQGDYVVEITKSGGSTAATSGAGTGSA